MQFTGLQLSAILKLAKAMVAADGKVEDTELAALALEMAQFGVTEDKLSTFLDLSDAMEASTAMAVVSSMTALQKKYVCSYLAVIMVADGDVDDKESALWSLLSALCDFPEMTIAEAIKFWKEN